MNKIIIIKWKVKLNMICHHITSMYIYVYIYVCVCVCVYTHHLVTFKTTKNSIVYVTSPILYTIYVYGMCTKRAR